MGPDADLLRRQGLGQYFTPRGLADFAWAALQILWRAEHGGEIPREARAIDPAAGEGVFLQAALDAGIAPEGLVGIDIDDTLLEAWRSRFRDHPAATPHLCDALCDDPSPGGGAGEFQFAVGNPPFAGRGLRELADLLRERPSQLGLGAGPPAAAKDQALLQQARLRERARILTERYVTWRLEEGGAVAALHAQSLRFPAQGPLSQAEREAVRRLAAFPIEVLFTERFVQLLRPGGYGAIILPEALCAKSRQRAFRRWFLRRAQPIALVGLPPAVFQGVGAKLATLLLLFRKRALAEQTGPEFPADGQVLATAPEDPFRAQQLKGYLDSVLRTLRARFGAGRA